MGRVGRLLGAFAGGSVVAGVALEDDGGGAAEAGDFAVADGEQAGAVAGHEAGFAFALDDAFGHLPEGGNVRRRRG